MKEVLLKIKTFINNLTSKVGDKKMHFTCSFVITLIVGLFNIIGGIVTGCACGLLKEFYDEFRYREHSDGVGFDKKDLTADALGVIVASIILLIL